MKILRSSLLLCVWCAGVCPAFGGTISGITVGLDGIEPISGVAISARRIGQTGLRENIIFKRTVSGADGRFAIDVGDTPVVELLFENGPRVKTFLQRLGGLNDMPGLVVVAPFGLDEEQPPCTSACAPICCNAHSRPAAKRYVEKPPRQIVPTAVSKTKALREWTNTKGKKMTAMLVQIDGAKAYFERADGRRTSTALAGLSPVDRNYINEWLKSQRIAKRTK